MRRHLIVKVTRDLEVDTYGPLTYCTAEHGHAPGIGDWNARWHVVICGRRTAGVLWGPPFSVSNSRSTSILNVSSTISVTTCTHGVTC